MFSGNVLSVCAETVQTTSSDGEVVEEFDVYDSGIADGIRIIDVEKTPNVETKSHIKYKVTKLSTTSEIGDYTGQSVSGEPGVTISLSNMKAISFSASSNVEWKLKSKAQAELGFDFNKSYTISHSGSRTVPSKYNGKKVKRAEIKAYRLYDKHTFKITWTSFRVKTPQYYGTYWAKKPSGYHYKVVYYYK